MKSNMLKDTLKEIDAISKLLKESYVFDEREPQVTPEEGMPMDAEWKVVCQWKVQTCWQLIRELTKLE